MKNYLKLLFCFCMLATVASCSKDDNTAQPPQKISGLLAEELNEAILLTWNIPTDATTSSIKITYDNKTVEVNKSLNSKKIEGLTNGTDYTFNLTAIDASGISSESVSIKATPDKYVTIIQGKDIENGTYTDGGPSLPIELLYSDNNKCTQTLSAGSDRYIWEGTWSFENDSTYKFESEYYSKTFMGTSSKSKQIERSTPNLCYDLSDTTFIVEFAYEKIEGDSKFIEGKYKRYTKTVSQDTPSSNDTTYYYAEISSSSIKYTDSDGNSSENTWSNNDLLNGDFIFVTYKSITYLIDNEKSRKYYKK